MTHTTSDTTSDTTSEQPIDETTIECPTDLPLVRIVRTFDAPPAKVFRAHTDPDLLLQWNGPRDTTMRIDHFDCRTGGSYRYTHTTSTAFVAGFYGSFHEVRADELIVQTFAFDGMPDGVALEKLHFEDIGGGRTRLVATSLVDSIADRDAFVASGMEQGVREGYERLDELLTR
ncbi:MAG: SRPBCC family protein [Acidimicrobiales bacterium]|nr:SRPBCC family protein [Acidimicrobiales bacterium]